MRICKCVRDVLMYVRMVQMPWNNMHIYFMHSGVAEINEMRMAKVIVDNLMCGRMYTIVAEGRVNNIDQSVGPGFFVKNITSSCPPPPTTAIAPTTSMTGKMTSHHNQGCFQVQENSFRFLILNDL